MDTVSDFCDHDIKPIVTENYDGGELRLGTSDTILSPKNFPHLAGLKGRTLITSDGTTVLGADDKAGIAEIMTMAENILCSNVPHGKIRLAFTPDEEIGRGADYFDVEGFAADFAYTVDGGALGEIEYENFNAASAVVTVRGAGIHPSGGEFDVLDIQGSHISAGAGVRLKKLVSASVQNGLGGLEWMDGIPGNVGGSLRMNAGAMGMDMIQNLVSVVCLGEQTGYRFR